MQSLIFFNKEGDNLNFTYNEQEERWEGDLLFHINSDDTFKTIGLYTFERIKSFSYENVGNLKLKKFQLFNEYRFQFTGNSNFTQPITKIELPNEDPNFYSKWIYGENFESKFPKGSQIKFDNPLFEFTNPIQTYTVVSTKKNAILILSNVDNKSFKQFYGIGMGNTNSYVGQTITGLNTIGFYNYLTEDFRENFSEWSEPDFYNRFYNGRKLNIINTTKNDGIVTVKNKDLFDRVYYKYEFSRSNFTQSDDFGIKIDLKTESPIVYTGSLNFNGYKLYFGGNIPRVLKPGSVFYIPTSSANSNLLTVDNIPLFIGNTNLTYYQVENQVIYSNLIYECIQSYTWSATSSITPENTSYWTRPKYLPLINELTSEQLYNTELHLSNSVLLYTQSFTQSAVVTLNSIVEKYKEEFSLFDLDLYYNQNALHVDLIYPTDYANIEFYLSNSGTYSFATKKTLYEHSVETKEILTTEFNINTNSNFKYNIVFTDLDEYGLKIIINNQVYNQEIVWVYEASQVNLKRTVDKTLRKWFDTWYLRLFTIGIKAKVGFTGPISTVYYNTISISTVYPNVPIDFSVEVGLTADYYIEHSEVVFKDISNYLTLIINDKSYGISSTIISAQNFDIPTTLSNWVDEYRETLLDYGIIVINQNNILIFRTKTQDQRLEITVQVGKSGLPAEDLYLIIPKFFGSFGSLITSNEIILPGSSLVTVDTGGQSTNVVTPPTWSFYDQSFLNGQVLGINNTIYPWNNQEYNLITLDPQSLILDYRGPFWSTTDPVCEVSPFALIGFDDGFGATGCIVITQSIDLGGEYTRLEYQNAFTINFGVSNSYSGQAYTVTQNTNLTDIVYASITENLYILGNRLSVYDANRVEQTTTVDLPGLTGPIQIDINPSNQYIYCLSNYGLHLVDPRLNVVEKQFQFTVNDPKKFIFNTNNGDLYVIFNTSNIIKIWKSTNFTTTSDFTLSLSGNALDLIENQSDNQIYVTCDDNTINIIDGRTRSLIGNDQYDALANPLFYEPSESAVYVFDSLGLKKFNNGLTYSFNTVFSEDTNYFVYNNQYDQIVISQTTQFVALNRDGGVISSVLTPSVGPMVINQYDGDVYQATGNELKVLDTLGGRFKWSERFDGNIVKIIYNASRNSVIGIIPNNPSVIEAGSLVELQVTLGGVISTGYTGSISAFDEGLFGTLDPNYQQRPDTWLNVREFITTPKENSIGDTQVKLVWKWEDDQIPEMFLFDFTGNQLTTTGSFSYVGPKPLTSIRLNNSPNQDLTKVSLPEYQQTVFDEVIQPIDYIDSDLEVTQETQPLELFIGYNSKDEGPTKSILKLYKREEIEFSITSSPNNFDILQFKTGDDGLLYIYINQNSDTTFYTDDEGKNRGLKVGQIIQIFITDVTNPRNKYISHNNGITFKITNVFAKTLIGQKIDRTFTNEFTVISDYPKEGMVTYTSTRFLNLDKEIGRFDVYGQTVIEDIRFKVELGNSGQLVKPDDIYIFKEYDINEQGIDWVYLNNKRKELLMVRDEIYSFIGSYKAIINAINYFGYNDLELYEYYRNINTESKDYEKLFKVEIPDIFDNTVAGWTPNDFIKHTLPNPNYEDTNLFNLTFKITDKEGNNVLYYSLNEVLIKLQGLKNWLESNVIPLTHRILDITGRADFVGVTSIQHKSYNTRIFKVEQNFTPIDFRLNEAYLMPVNSGSTVYTCMLDFFVAETTLMPDYFQFKIRTYQTYKEWQPFAVYNKGDKVQYYQQIYESAIDDNRLKNPRKFDNVVEWSSTTNYNLGDYASYYRDIYQYIGTQSSYSIYGSYSISPVADISTNFSFAKWVLMTEWKKFDYLPIQTLTEFRTATHSYTFTVDSNLDPFVLIEVTSDNGYGQLYNNKKSYEIRGTKDLIDDPGRPDPMGPFNPIVFVESTAPAYPTFSTPLFLLDVKGGESIEYEISANMNVLKWEVNEIGFSTNAIATVTLAPISQRSVNIIVNADPKTKSGIVTFTIKAIIKGGYFTISRAIFAPLVEVTCPILTIETSPFANDFNVPDIGINSSYILGVSSNGFVTWEIFNVVTTLSDLEISFIVNGSVNAQVLIKPGPNTPTGNYSFQLRSISQDFSVCIAESGIISGQILNIQDNGKYWKASASITCNNYVSDLGTTNNTYNVITTNRVTPQGIVADLIVYKQSGTNRYDLFILVDSIIESVEVTNFNCDIIPTAIYSPTLDNNGIPGLPSNFKYKFKFLSPDVEINAPPSTFNIKVNFI